LNANWFKTLFLGKTNSRSNVRDCLEDSPKPEGVE